MQKPKIVYEWILTPVRGDDYILTENQYEFYKEHYNEAKIFFSDIEISPRHIVGAFRRPALYIKNKYPCNACHAVGYVPGNNGVICSTCKGSGIDIPKKP